MLNQTLKIKIKIRASYHYNLLNEFHRKQETSNIALLAAQFRESTVSFYFKSQYERTKSKLYTLVQIQKESKTTYITTTVIFWGIVKNFIKTFNDEVVYI